MKRVLFTALFFACATGAAGAKGLDAQIMTQPGAPIRVVGCSAETYPLRNGQNFTIQTSFEDVGPRTATAVRIGFAFFDALGERHVYNGLSTGTFSPDARIDVKPFGGQVGAEMRRVVCFAMQAAFADGTTWKASQYPAAAPPPGAPAEGSVLPADIVKQSDAPVRFDTCEITAPKDTFMTTNLLLTNVSAKVVRRVDVDFAMADGSGGTGAYYEWMTGSYAPGRVIHGSSPLRVHDVAFTKATCSVRRVDFADGTSWSAPPKQDPSQP